MDKTLELVISSGCNLNCSYCYLHKNLAYLNVDKKILESIKDGSFVQNMLRSLHGMQIECKDFTELQLWGAEPSRHFLEMEEMFKQIFFYFPNIKAISYSSNFLTPVETHLKLIECIEKYNQNNDFHLSLQISVDGPDEISLRTRHYKYEEIHNNLALFIEKINNVKLKKTKLDIHYKSTLPLDILKEVVSSKEKYTYFVDFFMKEEEFFLEEIKNKKVDFSVGSCFGGSIVYPIECTQQDGIAFTYYAKMLDSWDIGKKYNYKYEFNMVLAYCGLVGRDAELIGTFLPGCQKMSSNLMFRYDGSLASCSNGFLDDNEENLNYLKENDPKEFESCSKTTFLIKTKYDNNGKVEISDLNKKRKFMKEFWKDHSNFTITVICAELLDLANAGLISPIYLQNSTKIYQHSFLLFNRLGCYLNNIRYSGSPYVPSSSFAKLLCNGLCEYFEDRIKLVEEIYKDD